MNNPLVEIPKLPEPIILELLIRSKLLLEHALYHANNASPLDKSLAIHGFDNNIECILKIISIHLDIENITGNTLDENSLSALIGEINKFLSSNYNFNLPYYADLKIIRKIRNLVQHGAIDPEPNIDKFSKITERFFNKILDIFFGISKEELRISTIAKNPEVKKHLLLAEKYIDSKEFLLSTVASRDAFENALFSQIKNSDIKLSSIPALMEMRKSENKSYWFFDKITDEIELSRLNINLKKYDRFSEYVRYIPREYNADKSSTNIIMQRPWNSKDAMFCYSFVSETIIKWQEEELEPIYNPRYPIDSYISETKIGEVVISEYMEHGCFYDFGFDSTMELIYVNRLVKENLDKLMPEKIYLYSDKTLKKGELDTVREFNIKLLNINKKLITNNPERWEIALWYDQIPFTWCKKDYKGSKVIKETLCINTANEENLISLNENIITKKLAKKIVALRKAIGKICSIEDLKKIGSINNEQIMWLSRYTRL